MSGSTKLSVRGTGATRHIEVPSEKSNLLHTYLWSQNIRTSPPAPHTPGIDSIALAESEDGDAVQKLLDWWA